MRITYSGNVGIGTTNPSSVLDIAGGGLEVNSGDIAHSYSNADAQTLVRYVAGTLGNSQVLGTVQIPADSGIWFVEVLSIHGRGTQGNGGTFNVAKEYFAILRLNSSTDVVIDASIAGGGAFDETTSSAGGSGDATAVGLNCARAGSEASDQPQNVEFRANCGVSGGSTGYNNAIIRIIGSSRLTVIN